MALLLDSYSAPGSRAYSMERKLRSAYAGSAYQVQRSSDSATLDIGFSGNLVDHASMRTFVGANTGYVSKIYDQSVNVRDITCLYNGFSCRTAGVDETLGGKVCARFVASAIGVSTPPLGASSPVSIGMVYSWDTALGGTDDEIFWDDVFDSMGFGQINNHQHLFRWYTQSIGESTSTISANAMVVGGVVYDLTNYKFYRSGAADGTGSNALSPSTWGSGSSQMAIGGRFGNSAGRILELVFHENALSGGDQAVLYGDQNSYYNGGAAPIVPFRRNLFYVEA